MRPSRRRAMIQGSKRVKVRSLAHEDIPLMIRLWKESGLHYKPKGRDSLKNLRTQHSKDPELFLGAFRGKELVGVLLASDDGRRAWINRLAVHPSARRSGVAIALIDHAERVMRRRGRRLFCAQIESDNPTSMRLFEAAGYRREKDIFYYTKRELRSY